MPHISYELHRQTLRNAHVTLHCFPLHLPPLSLLHRKCSVGSQDRVFIPLSNDALSTELKSFTWEDGLGRTSKEVIMPYGSIYLEELRQTTLPSDRQLNPLTSDILTIMNDV